MTCCSYRVCGRISFVVRERFICPPPQQKLYSRHTRTPASYVQWCLVAFTARVDVGPSLQQCANRADRCYPKTNRYMERRVPIVAGGLGLGVDISPSFQQNTDSSAVVKGTFAGCSTV
ncbi:unnamed protein product [Ectocarpus fasciculatus]